MKTFILLASVLLPGINIAIAGTLSEREIYLSATLLERVFPLADNTRAISHSFSAEEKNQMMNTLGSFRLRDSLLVIASSKQGTLLGFAVVDHVRGKDQPITYCIVVDPSLHVMTTEILVYRESYGGEVQRRSWLDQFIGKSPDDQLRPGRDIKNITGATISARSVTLGVAQILTVLRIVEPRLLRELQ